MQLLFAFVILSTITIIAILLIMLSKNTRSQKVHQLASNNDWQYQEFADFSDAIKSANFGILNYSQNAVFRHLISADDNHYGLGFNFFDCRAVEAVGIHNSSIILFNLSLHADYSDLHCSIIPKNNHTHVSQNQQSPIDHHHLARILRMQKLIKSEPHYAFEKHSLHSNQPVLLERFLKEKCKANTIQSSSKDAPQAIQDNTEQLNTWLLAHPHLHIEISNGILLAYQPNHLLADDSILLAIDEVAKLSNGLSRTS